MGNLCTEPLVSVVHHLRNRFDLEVMVETGTFTGQTALWASNHFRQVVTIEASPTIYQRARATLHSASGVELHLGDSRSHLRRIVEHLRGPALFWLDGHWSGAETHGEKDECPLMDELAAIREMHPKSCVLIDDARFFLAPPPRPHNPTHWPTIDQVIMTLRRAPASHTITVFHDVIMATPTEAISDFRDFIAQLVTIHSTQQNTGAQRFWDRISRWIKA